MVYMVVSVAFSLLSTVRGGLVTGVELELSQNFTRTASCSTPCEGLIGDLCTFGGAESHKQPAPKGGILPESIEETLRAVASEHGDVHCRAFAEWNYRFAPSDCQRPVGNRTPIVLLPTSRLSAKLPLLAYESADVVEADGATYGTVDVATTTALPIQLTSSPTMERFGSSSLMRREQKNSLIGKQTVRSKVTVRRQEKKDEGVAPNSSVRRETLQDSSLTSAPVPSAKTRVSAPKLLLRREATQVSFKEHLDFFMNILRSAALIFFLVSALGALGGGVVKLWSPEESVTAEVAPSPGNRDASSIRVQHRGEADAASE